MRLFALVWGAALTSCVGAFIVPDQLVSLLTVVYSVIPPIKKGSDSRVGFGYRFGPFADVQVLLELGPQTETRPIIADTDAPSGKRQTDPKQRPEDIQALDQEANKIGNARSARSGPAPAALVAAAAPPPPPLPGQSDWLSRWRSSVIPAAAPVAAPSNAVPVLVPAPPQPRRFTVAEGRTRSARAPGGVASPAFNAFAAPAAPRRTVLSPDARWEAMQRLRSLHWAGQQG